MSPMSTEQPSGAADSTADAQEQAALAAVDAIIADFGANRVADYFSGFAPEATFLFHAEPARLESRAEYEALWARWVAESGFAVLSCDSSERRIQLFGDTAIFSHTVDTTLSVRGEQVTAHERETIVMRLVDDRWVCIHEHLSLPS